MSIACRPFITQNSVKRCRGSQYGPVSHYNNFPFSRPALTASRPFFTRCRYAAAHRCRLKSRCHQLGPGSCGLYSIVCSCCTSILRASSSISRLLILSSKASTYASCPAVCPLCLGNCPSCLDTPGNSTWYRPSTMLAFNSPLLIRRRIVRGATPRLLAAWSTVMY